MSEIMPMTRPGIPNIKIHLIDNFFILISSDLIILSVNGTAGKEDPLKPTAVSSQVTEGTFFILLPFCGLFFIF